MVSLSPCGRNRGGAGSVGGESSGRRGGGSEGERSPSCITAWAFTETQCSEVPPPPTQYARAPPLTSPPPPLLSPRPYYVTNRWPQTCACASPVAPTTLHASHPLSSLPPRGRGPRVAGVADSRNQRGSASTRRNGEQRGSSTTRRVDRNGRQNGGDIP